MEVMKTTLSHLEISPDISILLAIRTHDDGPWDEDKEDKPVWPTTRFIASWLTV